MRTTYTILVVEDDAAIAEMLQTVLEDEGYAVVAASDGVEALERLSERPYDLVLADLMMPRLDGRGLLAAISDSPDYQALPVVLMTAASNLIPRDQQDFAAVLHKPFHITTVIELIGRLLAPA